MAEGTHRRSLLLVAAVFAAVPWVLLSSKYNFNDASTSSVDDVDDVAGIIDEQSKSNTYQKDNEQWNQIKQLVCPNQVPNPSVWQSLFMQARIELGFDLENIPNTGADKHFVKEFFKFSSGGLGYSSSDGEHYMVYLKVWKGANDHIRENIVIRANPDNYWEFSPDIIMMEDYGDRDFSELWSPIPLSKRNQTCVVTAVRDPIEHFLSGYNELEFRSTPSFHTAHKVRPDGKVRQYERYKYGNEARFEQYVSDFLWGPRSGVSHSEY